MPIIWNWIGAVTALVSTALASDGCYCLPSESCWPSESTWSAFNTTVGGQLVATVPIGHPCHDPYYDEEACTALQDVWYLPQTHIVSSSSVMQTYFANHSCDPFTAESTPCVLGNYVAYAVNVSSSSDVVAAIEFAQTNNIRLVIRNTGHDYFGRSTGAGALSVWTHYLNDIDFSEWSDSTYSGPAIKMGAGVMGYQAIEAAADKGLVVVTGECPTVGLAGGYTQGGGHSVLSTAFGLAADQVLQFEVVIANGTVVNATRAENADLYWALCGGGAGNYGVVLSMTVKAYEDNMVSGALLEFAAAYTTIDAFYEAITQFHALLPAMLNAGVTIVYEITSETFVIVPVTAYNQTEDDVKAILAPFTTVLTNLSIPYDATFTSFPSYIDHYNAYMGPLPYGNLDVEGYQYGGRLIPREVLENNPTEFVAVLRNLTENGVTLVGVGLDVSSNVTNAVLPSWRTSAVTMQLVIPWNETAPWSQMVANQFQMTDEFVPQIEAVTPGAGCYMNEADFRQPNWQETFFGSNYDALLSIKNKWDPEYFFYGLNAVGSEYWTVTESGVMCKT